MKGSIFSETNAVRKVKPKTSKQILWEAAPKGDHEAIRIELEKVTLTHALWIRKDRVKSSFSLQRR